MESCLTDTEARELETAPALAQSMASLLNVSLYLKAEMRGGRGGGDGIGGDGGGGGGDGGGEGGGPVLKTWNISSYSEAGTFKKRATQLSGLSRLYVPHKS